RVECGDDAPRVDEVRVLEQRDARLIGDHVGSYVSGGCSVVRAVSVSVVSVRVTRETRVGGIVPSDRACADDAYAERGDEDPCFTHEIYSFTPDSCIGCATSKSRARSVVLVRAARSSRDRCNRAVPQYQDWMPRT